MLFSADSSWEVTDVSSSPAVAEYSGMRKDSAMASAVIVLPFPGGPLSSITTP